MTRMGGSSCGVSFFTNIDCTQPELAEEGHEIQTEHVERSQSGSDNADRPQDLAAVGTGKDLPENLILTKEPGEGKNPGDSKRGGQHHGMGPGNLLPETPHAAHVLLAAESMNHRPGAEEEQCLEESVRHEMENAGGIRCYAAGQEHVAQLRDGGVGQHALDIG